MEPEDVEYVDWVQLRVGEELSPPFRVCRTCRRPSGRMRTMEFSQGISASVEAWNPGQDVEDGLRELGFS